MKPPTPPAPPPLNSPPLNSPPANSAHRPEKRFAPQGDGEAGVGSGAAPPATPAQDGPALTERQEKILAYVQSFQEERGYPPSIREIGEHFGIRSTNGVSDHLRALERKGVLQRSGHLSRSLRVVPSDETQAATELARIKGQARIEGQARTKTEARLANRELVREAYAPGEPELVEREFQREARGNVLPLARREKNPRDQALVRRERPDARSQSALVPVLGKVAAGQPLLAVEDAEETLVVDQYLLGGPGEVFALRVVGESMIEAGILPGDFVFVKKREAARPGEIVVALLAGEATVKRWYPEGDTIRLQPENRTMQPIYVRRGDATQCQLIGTVVGVYRRL